MYDETDQTVTFSRILPGSEHNPAWSSELGRTQLLGTVPGANHRPAHRRRGTLPGKPNLQRFSIQRRIMTGVVVAFAAVVAALIISIFAGYPPLIVVPFMH